MLPYHRAGRATGPEILRSFRIAAGCCANRGVTPSRLPAALQGFLPEHIRIRQRRNSLDLPEHRQMAACLRSWSAWLGAAADCLERGQNPPPDLTAPVGAAVWAARCRRLCPSRRPAVIGRALCGSGEAPPRLVLSALFRNDPAYRRFYRLWQDMNLGIAAVFGDFLNLPLARTFELYELWCFLRLVRAGAEEFGPAGLEFRISSSVTPRRPDARGRRRHRTGRSGLEAVLSEAVPRILDRDGPARCLQPDDGTGRRGYVGPGGAGTARLIVLDAKYRIDDGLNDALNSIHTYRDALVRGAQAAHRRHRNGGPSDAAHADYSTDTGTPMPGRLFHPEYRSSSDSAP